MGPKTCLSREEEKELVDFLINCAKTGFAKTTQYVMSLVHMAAQKKEIKSYVAGGCIFVRCSPS